MNEPTLSCSNCKRVKPVSEFYARSSCARGFDYWCKNCRNRVSRVNIHRTAKQREYKDKWISKNKIKSLAHKAVKLAVKRGDLVKPTHCSQCNKVRKVQAHHPDYENPLEVTWLCTKCHYALHHHVQLEMKRLRNMLRPIINEGLRKMKINYAIDFTPLLEDVTAFAYQVKQEVKPSDDP